MFITHLSLFLLALTLLLYAANVLLSSAYIISKQYNISPFIIGIIVIGFATSLPEFTVSGLASMKDQGALAIGNAFGSNITNMLAVLGLTALMMGVKSSNQSLSYMYLLTIISMLLVTFLLWNMQLERIEGLVLVVVLIGIMIYIVRKEKKLEHTQDLNENVKGFIGKLILKKPILALTISLFILLLASNMIVNEATYFARLLNISELIIGLTIVAIGTSLPELTTAILGTYRKQHSLALGNLLGSNLFNTLGVLGIAALTRPIIVDNEVIFREIPVMLGSVLLVWVLFVVSKTKGLGFISGVLLLSCFIVYTSYLYIAN